MAGSALFFLNEGANKSGLFRILCAKPGAGGCSPGFNLHLRIGDNFVTSLVILLEVYAPPPFALASHEDMRLWEARYWFIQGTP